jgi:hypothetical protein
MPGGAQDGQGVAPVQPAAAIAAVVRDQRRPAGVVDDQPAQHVAVVEHERAIVPVLSEPTATGRHLRQLRAAV